MALTLAYCLTALPDELLHVYILDIGQGDSILIRTPLQQNILVDGGPDDRVIQRISQILPFYEKTIDLIVLTHPHADHVNGLVDVLKRYNVKTVLLTGASYNYPGYVEFLNLINQKKIQVVMANPKQDLKLGNILLDIIYPLESISGRSFENLNNSSMVFRLFHGSRKFYFTGDLELAGEENLLKSGLDLRADFLKAGHHGSRTSSSEALLDSIRPLYAGISCGIDNTFKHPHPETIKHLQARGISIYRTDLDGTVEAISDGKKINVLPRGKN